MRVLVTAERMSLFTWGSGVEMGVEMKAPSRYLTERRRSRVNAAVGLFFA
jgi:hypothetical protein